jgi:chemotaxis protein MotB
MRRPDPHEQENEGYFASVSDLMVGILFIFLLLLAIFAANYQDDDVVPRGLLDRCEKKAHQFQEALAEAVKALEELNDNILTINSVKARIAGIEAELTRQDDSTRLAEKKLLTAIQKSIDAQNANLAPQDQVVFEIDESAAVLRLTDAIPFASQKSELNEKAMQTVHILADVLAEILPCYLPQSANKSCSYAGGALLETVLIEGHTDAKPWRRDHIPMTADESKRLNDELSSARALSVLSEMGVSKPELEGLKNNENLPVFGISGYGQRRLRNYTEDSPNRRIDVRFILYPDNSLAMRPMLDDINKMLAAPSARDYGQLIQSIHELLAR